MKKYLSLIIFFSLFLIQIHGSTHAEFSDHHKNTICITCEVVSHQSSLVPTTVDLNLNAQLSLELLFLITDPDFIFQSFISKSHSPRGPPHV